MDFTRFPRGSPICTELKRRSDTLVVEWRSFVVLRPQPVAERKRPLLLGVGAGVDGGATPLSPRRLSRGRCQRPLFGADTPFPPPPPPPPHSPLQPVHSTNNVDNQVLIYWEASPPPSPWPPSPTTPSSLLETLLELSHSLTAILAIEAQSFT